MNDFEDMFPDDKSARMSISSHRSNVSGNSGGGERNTPKNATKEGGREDKTEKTEVEGQQYEDYTKEGGSEKTEKTEVEEQQ